MTVAGSVVNGVCAFMNSFENTGGRALPFLFFFFFFFSSKGLPLLHVWSAQRAGRTQHRTKDNSHQEQRQIKAQLQRRQMEWKWERNLLKTPYNSTHRPSNYDAISLPVIKWARCIKAWVANRSTWCGLQSAENYSIYAECNIVFNTTVGSKVDVCSDLTHVMDREA